ncbi:MAG: hypothetical protein IPO07_20495 [Haliscomenobacter sp.]|nr:hypothetical protein [Haliscomenobacter sp.]MBK9490895.1 hypothetical protein [Haliscomenobacter sp.]
MVLALLEQRGGKKQNRLAMIRLQLMESERAFGKLYCHQELSPKMQVAEQFRLMITNTILLFLKYKPFKGEEGHLQYSTQNHGLKNYLGGLSPYCRC